MLFRTRSAKTRKAVRLADVQRGIRRSREIVEFGKLRYDFRSIDASIETESKSPKKGANVSGALATTMNLHVDVARASEDGVDKGGADQGTVDQAGACQGDTGQSDTCQFDAARRADRPTGNVRMTDDPRKATSCDGRKTLKKFQQLWSGGQATFDRLDLDVFGDDRCRDEIHAPQQRSRLDTYRRAGPRLECNRDVGRTEKEVKRSDIGESFPSRSQCDSVFLPAINQSLPPQHPLRKYDRNEDDDDDNIRRSDGMTSSFTYAGVDANRSGIRKLPVPIRPEPEVAVNDDATTSKSPARRFPLLETQRPSRVDRSVEPGVVDGSRRRQSIIRQRRHFRRAGRTVPANFWSDNPRIVCISWDEDLFKSGADTLGRTRQTSDGGGGGSTVLTTTMVTKTISRQKRSVLLSGDGDQCDAFPSVDRSYRMTRETTHFLLDRVDHLLRGLPE